MNPPTDSQALLRQRVGALALAAVGLVFIWRSVSDLPFGTIDNPCLLYTSDAADEL